jgi:ribosomal protein L11 methyltransferase
VAGPNRETGATQAFVQAISIMTFVAVLALDEARGRALVERLGEDEALALRPVDLSETAPGRWEIVVYFEEEPRPGELAALSRGSAAVLGRRASGFAIEELPDTDWVKRSLDGLKPIRVGRFLVHGRHDRERRRPNDIAIEIEAGEAFGTGHHGSTAGCLAAIDALTKARPVRNALDLGTGSGILAIALARIVHVPVLASDIDGIAVKVAAANATLNGVGRLVTVITAAGVSGRAFRERAPFDLIVANILAGPLVRLAPGIRRHLALGGTIILSGLLPGQQARVVAAYRGQGSRLVRGTIRDGWLTLVFERKPIRTAGTRGRPARAPRAGGRK